MLNWPWKSLETDADLCGDMNHALYLLDSLDRNERTRMLAA